MQSKIILWDFFFFLASYFPLALPEKAIIIMCTFVILLSLQIKTITPAFVCQIMGKQINCPSLN